MRSKPARYATIVVFALCGPALSGEGCTCRGNGQDIPEGQTVCLKTASGHKLARCERVLNNTSWKLLDADCPTATLPPRSVDALENGQGFS
ncbi:hypothetical protein [Oricola thermophila]|uniref:DUF333 domain-containing protein n=1 Tax=Oricola thermophila TaxID=2742145 RepID=A0A6N1VB22_9HYPH|nr:hypothetical protein [Oricola thermophila]QKV17743.1 hypothetical protein HTY61_04305 [Oricola thermophila]